MNRHGHTKRSLPVALYGDRAYNPGMSAELGIGGPLPILPPGTRWEHRDGVIFAALEDSPLSPIGYKERARGEIVRSEEIADIAWDQWCSKHHVAGEIADEKRTGWSDAFERAVVLDRSGPIRSRLEGVHAVETSTTSILVRGIGEALRKEILTESVRWGAVFELAVARWGPLAFALPLGSALWGYRIPQSPKPIVDNAHSMRHATLMALFWQPKGEAQ